MTGVLGHAEPALAPQDSGNFLDEMRFGGTGRIMLGQERIEEGIVFYGSLPRQQCVLR